MSRLYPPNISGTLPSFYKNSREGAVITVPFSMNKIVSISDVGGMSLRLKTAYTDRTLGIVSGSIQNAEDSGSLCAVFTLSESIVQNLVVGEFYKAQIAYREKDNDIIGYYSTVGVIKCTAQPTVEIINFSTQSTNLNVSEYIGAYYNAEDPTEKVYQYKFTLMTQANNVIETSGWKIHNSYTDESTAESIDTYTVKHAFEENVIYKIQYSIITNNGLEVKTPRYLVMQSESVDPELKVSLKAELDYDNACINLKLAREEETGAASGAFVLTRANSLDNFSTWTTITDFRLTGDLPEDVLFRDYTIEQGAIYRYSLQQYNDSKIYSNRILADDITAKFEDAFLYDGTRQLKIRFNPKVSSFKTVLQENKKTTIGSKYPFIFRSGAVEYKEFPISGLISYMMDNDEFFLSLKDIGAPLGWQETTDITDENIALERKFKLAVLDWLNDGQVKLFKSPAEGNYLVRLMNVSLTPNDSVSRMIHTFNCTATEIAEFNDETLGAYSFLDVEAPEIKQMRWGTIVFQDLFNELTEKKSYENPDLSDSELWEAVVQDIMNYDLMKGYACYHLKLENIPFGLGFTLGSMNFIIGATGQYEAKFDTPLRTLNFSSKDIDFIRSHRYSMPGSLTYGIMSTSSNKFDTINKVEIYDVTLHQQFGPSDDIFADFKDLKRTVTKMYFARFTSLEIQEVESKSYLDNLLILQRQQTDFSATNILTPYVIYKSLENGLYYQFVPSINRRDGTIKRLSDVSTEIEWGDTVLSVAEDNEIYIPNLDTVPDHCKIGGAVCAEISFQIKEISYGVESNLEREKSKMESAYQAWLARAIGLTSADVVKADASYDQYVFEGHSFKMLNDREVSEYAERKVKAWKVIIDGSALPGQSSITNLRKKYDQAHQDYMEKLEYELQEKEAELA